MYFQNKEYRIEQFFHGRPLSIWEMRNPMIYLKYAETICEYNFSDQVTTTISEICPMDPKNLFIHQVLKEWAPTLLSNIDAIKTALTEANDTHNLMIVDLVKETFLFDDYENYFESMIPIPNPEEAEASFQFPIVFGHNDAQENNILMNIGDNRNMMVIDYEYGGWNPMAFDLANYLNECMLENAYPLKNGINWYTENIMQGNELEGMIKRYMETYFNKYMHLQYPGLKEKKYENNSQLFVEAEYENLLK